MYRSVPQRAARSRSVTAAPYVKDVCAPDKARVDAQHVCRLLQAQRVAQSARRYRVRKRRVRNVHDALAGVARFMIFGMVQDAESHEPDSRRAQPHIQSGTRVPDDSKKERRIVQDVIHLFTAKAAEILYACWPHSRKLMKKNLSIRV